MEGYGLASPLCTGLFLKNLSNPIQISATIILKKHFIGQLPLPTVLWSCNDRSCDLLQPKNLQIWKTFCVFEQNVTTEIHFFCANKLFSPNRDEIIFLEYICNFLWRVNKIFTWNLFLSGTFILEGGGHHSLSKKLPNAHTLCIWFWLL